MKFIQVPPIPPIPHVHHPNFLLQEAVPGSPRIVFEISSEQSLMIPLWIACDNHEKSNYTGEQITKRANTFQCNLGNIGSEVTVDGQRVANLNVRMILDSGKLNYKINTLDKVTEIYSKKFNLTS